MATSDAPILLTGVHGQVGAALLPLLQRFGAVVSPTRVELDLGDPDALRAYVRAVRPRWIVNPAAYTAVDKAEQEPELAFAINATAPRVFGEEAAALGIPVIHFSTDYVFPGDGVEPWRENDPTGPLSVYGTSKLEGELALAASGAEYIIFRTSWVYGATGNNFLRTILRYAREKEEMKIVADQHGSPTWAYSLATLVGATIQRFEAEGIRRQVPVKEAVHSFSGIYHASDAGSTTWFGFAEEFLRLAQLFEPSLRFAKLLPITTAEYPTPAKRPLNSRLNCGKLTTALGFTMPDWKDSVAKVMAETSFAK